MSTVYIPPQQTDSSAVPIPSCPYCGSWPHPSGPLGCPSVSKIEFYPDGTIKSVEKK